MACFESFRADKVRVEAMKSVDQTPELRDWTVWRNRTGEDLRNVSAALKVPRKVRGLHQSGMEGV